MNELQEALHDAVISAEAACVVLGRSDAPFARVLLREAQEGASKLRNCRDTLAAALLEAGRLTAHVERALESERGHFLNDRTQRQNPARKPFDGGVEKP